MAGRSQSPRAGSPARGSSPRPRSAGSTPRASGTPRSGSAPRSGSPGSKPRRRRRRSASPPPVVAPRSAAYTQLRFAAKGVEAIARRVEQTLSIVQGATSELQHAADGARLRMASNPSCGVGTAVGDALASLSRHAQHSCRLLSSEELLLREQLALLADATAGLELHASDARPLRPPEPLREGAPQDGSAELDEAIHLAGQREDAARRACTGAISTARAARADLASQRAKASAAAVAIRGAAMAQERSRLAAARGLRAADRSFPLVAAARAEAAAARAEAAGPPASPTAGPAEPAAAAAAAAALELAPEVVPIPMPLRCVRVDAIMQLAEAARLERAAQATVAFEEPNVAAGRRLSVGGARQASSRGVAPSPGSADGESPPRPGLSRASSSSRNGFGPIDYSTATCLWTALAEANAPVRLLSGRWLAQLPAEGNVGRKIARRRGSKTEGFDYAVREDAAPLVRRVLARRQELPEEAFLSVDELRAIHDASRAYPVLEVSVDGTRCATLAKRAPVIAISHAWRSKSHPDPHGETLRVVAEALREWMPRYEAKGVTDVGVFIDWGCVHQLPLEDAEAQLMARRSLKHCELWYAHALTTTYLVQAHGKAAHAERGWCAFERQLAWLAKLLGSPEARDDSSNVWPQVVEIGGAAAAAAAAAAAIKGQPPPLPPPLAPPEMVPAEAFEEGGVLGHLRYSKRVPDQRLVGRKFREACEDMAAASGEREPVGF